MIDHLGLVAADLGRSGHFYRAILEPLGIAQLEDHGAVDRFHAGGLDAGGKDTGGPGERAGRHPYYAAFLIDPDGNNVEAGVRGS